MTPLQAAVTVVNAAHRQLQHAEAALLRVQPRERQKTAQCGTPSGYNRHWLADEDPCHACRVAHRAYHASWKARRVK